MILPVIWRTPLTRFFADPFVSIKIIFKKVKQRIRLRFRVFLSFFLYFQHHHGAARLSLLCFCASLWLRHCHISSIYAHFGPGKVNFLQVLKHLNKYLLLIWHVLGHILFAIQWNQIDSGADWSGFQWGANVFDQIEHLHHIIWPQKLSWWVVDTSLHTDCWLVSWSHESLSSLCVLELFDLTNFKQQLTFLILINTRSLLQLFSSSLFTPLARLL